MLLVFMSCWLTFGTVGTSWLQQVRPVLGLQIKTSCELWILWVWQTRWEFRQNYGTVIAQLSEHRHPKPPPPPHPLSLSSIPSNCPQSSILLNPGNMDEGSLVPRLSPKTFLFFIGARGEPGNEARMKEVSPAKWNLIRWLGRCFTHQTHKNFIIYVQPSPWQGHKINLQCCWCA